VKGVVDEVKVKQGDRVEKGQVVIVIRSKDLAEAVIGYLEAAKKVSFARRAYLRERKLWKKEISPKATYLQKRQEYSAARLARESAAQRLKAIGFSPAKVRAMSGRSRKELSLYEVETPLAGVVTKRLVTKGQAVTDEAELMEVADLSQVLVEVPVPARYLPVLEKGQEVELRSEKLDMEATGELVYISPTVDQRTRTARARVRVKNPQGKWRPGLCATVKLPTRSVEADVTVPNDAVLEIDGRPHVFVVKKPTVFELRPVTVGLSTGDRTQIRSGLSAGEVVVTGNAVTLKSAWQKMGGR
jgi:cobalt-zinc-cadmium efflux system membrane fusion protein